MATGPTVATSVFVACDAAHKPRSIRVTVHPMLCNMTPSTALLPDEHALQVKFWGVRGSICASGPDFVEFGCHTACVEIRCGTRLFILDAGTGLSALGAALGKNAPKDIDILLSHLHWDHVGGLPFFKPAVLQRGTVVRTHCGNLGGASAEEALNQLFSPPLFPITLDQFPARFEHRGFVAGDDLLFPDGTRIATVALNHPGGATGFRLEHRGRSVCYICDLEHSEPWPDKTLVEFTAGTDLVIYDAMFSQDEYSECQGWGHSSWRKGIDLCEAAGVSRMAAFHLSPCHDDTLLRLREKRMRAVMPGAFIARERQSLAFAAKPDDAK